MDGGIDKSLAAIGTCQGWVMCGGRCWNFRSALWHQKLCSDCFMKPNQACLLLKGWKALNLVKTTHYSHEILTGSLGRIGQSSLCLAFGLWSTVCNNHCQLDAVDSQSHNIWTLKINSQLIQERTQISELYYSRIEILGICLFLQSVLANLHASTYNSKNIP